MSSQTPVRPGARPGRTSRTAEKDKAPRPRRAYGATIDGATEVRVNGSSRNGTQATRDKETTRQLFTLPSVEETSSCIQCGTCSGSCPNVSSMSLAPNQVVNMLREGMAGEVLTSNTPWYCSACYLCSDRCPRDIPVTDIMYALKSMALRKAYKVADKKTSSLSTTFVDELNRRGRNHEMSLLTRFYLRGNPMSLLKMVPLGLRLLRRGRMPLLGEKIKDIKGFQAVVARAKKLGESR